MTWYDDTMRTIVDLPEELLAKLDALREREGISRAEAVRRAVRAYTADERPAAYEAAFGLWRSREVEGRAYEEALRGEWDHEA